MGLVLLVLTACVPASASAHVSRENAAATHSYLLASVRFEETEMADLPQEIAEKQAVAAGISGECAGILTNAPPNEEVFGFGLVGPAGPASKTRPSAKAEGERHRQSRQLGDLKLELPSALEDSRTQADREADEVLIRALTPLKWSDPRITFVFHVITEEAQEELDSPVPAVCADMQAWVASGYKTLSPTSKELAGRAKASLMRVFELIAVLEGTHIKFLSEILGRYENATDTALARRSQVLTTQLEQGSEAEADDLKRLEAAVGLPPRKPQSPNRPNGSPS